MDNDTFNRLVKYARDEITSTLQPDASDEEMLEIIHAMIEDVSGFEETSDAIELANRVLKRVKYNMSF